MQSIEEGENIPLYYMYILKSRSNPKSEPFRCSRQSNVALAEVRRLPVGCRQEL